MFLKSGKISKLLKFAGCMVSYLYFINPISFCFKTLQNRSSCFGSLLWASCFLNVT